MLKFGWTFGKNILNVVYLWSQLRCFEESKAAGRRGRDVGQPLVVNDYRIAVPEVDGGEVDGEDFLGFNVVGAAAGGVSAFGGIVEQGIEIGIGVMAAVGALG
jgi:hypothetical protein